MKKSVWVALLLGCVVILTACGLVAQAGENKGKILQEHVITYRGELCFSDVNAVGNDNIYMCLKDGEGICQIGIEGTSMDRYLLLIPDEMEVALLAVDGEDCVHALLHTREEYLADGTENRVEIWKADKQAEVVQTVDVTGILEAAGEEATVMQVGEDGVYCLTLTNGRVIAVDQSGQVLQAVKSEDSAAENTYNVEELEFVSDSEAEIDRTILGSHMLADGRLLVINTYVENDKQVTEFCFFAVAE